MSTSATGTTRANNTREQILDLALKLWARNGVGNTSMRTLADACGLNVAALYHYFDSKAALLDAVIDERQYGSLLADTDAPSAQDPKAQIAEIIAMLFEGAADEGRIWRLLVSESCRDNSDAQSVGVSLVEALDATVRRWLDDLDISTKTSRVSAAALIVEQLLGLLMQDLLEPRTITVESARARGLDLAECLIA